MPRHSKSSYNIALCGILSAMCIMFMFCTSFIPIGVYVLPAVSGIIVWIVSQQINRKWALLCYCAVTMLSLLVVPDMEPKILFLFFFGYYPTIRDILEKPRLKILRWLLKFLVFNIAVIISYVILLNLFGLSDLIGDFAEFGQYALLVFWGMGNIAFICYDICFTSIQFFYTKWIKPKLAKRIR